MSFASTSAVELLERAREGDAESLGSLLRKYFRYLNSLSRGHIDHRIRMRVSPSDVVQETLLEAHRDFPSFVGTSIEEFTGWLRKILFNNLARAIESHVLAAKRDVRKRRSLDGNNNSNASGPKYANSLPMDASTASSAMQRDESLKSLLAAISELPEDYREVIKLRHFEGLSFSEIAKRIDRSSGATRMLWVRAVKRLRSDIPPDQ